MDSNSLHLNNWISNGKIQKQIAQIRFHEKQTHTIIKMNDNINVDSAKAGSSNVDSAIAGSSNVDSAIAGSSNVDSAIAGSSNVDSAIAGSS